MAEIRPFRGVRYNPIKVAELSRVISPPYDIISPQQQDSLYQSSPYNFVHIEYNRETPQDNAADSRYTRAAAFISNWLKDGILVQEQAPAFYLHAHTFSVQGRKYLRHDIMAAVKLEEWDTKIIRPHENIIPRAKSDRMSMLNACQANTSQVLAMFADPKKAIADIMAQQKKSAPIMDFGDPWGEGHRVWAVTQAQAVKALQDEFSQQPLYIADGHHRYDSALTYRRERAARNKEHSGQEGYNYVFTSLIDFADPGLVILPTHRLVRGISKSALAALKAGLCNYFEMQEIALSGSGAWARIDSFLSGLTPDMAKVNLAVYGLSADSVTILSLKDFQTGANGMPPGHSDLYQKLDVSLVDHIILEKLLGYDKDKENLSLAYTHDRPEAVSRVAGGEYQLAVMLNPVSAEIIKGIADAGDRMPRKSTYFYPKAPAGLVFFKW